MRMMGEVWGRGRRRMEGLFDRGLEKVMGFFGWGVGRLAIASIGRVGGFV